MMWLNSVWRKVGFLLSRLSISGPLGSLSVFSHFENTVMLKQVLRGMASNANFIVM